MSKRRRQQEGSLFYDRSRDRWVGLAHVDGRRRKVTARKEADAARKLGALIHGDQTEAAADRRLTVATLLADWQRLHLAGKDRAPATKDVHAWAAGIIAAEIGSAKVSDLDVTKVEKMLSKLARRDPPLAKSSLIKVRSTLRQTFAWAQRRRLVTHNPAAVAELPPAVPTVRDRRALTGDEADALVSAMADHPMAPMWLLSLRLGLRPGEAAAVCGDALDLDATPPTVAVVRAVRLDRGRPQLVDDLKTKRARRTLAAPADLADELRPLVNGPGLLVTAPNGEPVWPSTGRAELAKVAEVAGLDWTPTPNEMRHTFATRMADGGVPPHVVADLLGHTSTRMVDAVYRHRPAVILGAEG